MAVQPAQKDIGRTIFLPGEQVGRIYICPEMHEEQDQVVDK